MFALEEIIKANNERLAQLRKAKKAIVAKPTEPNRGPYSGLTKAELAASGTCETDWY